MYWRKPVAVLFFVISLGYADASDNYTVNHGANLSITAHAECVSVTNNSGTGASVYVPTQTSAEWQSFRSKPPAGVAISSCVTPGSTTYSSPGTFTFTVPAHNRLIVQVWGAGGGGGGRVDRSTNYVNGSSGGASRWDSTITANGGKGAVNGSASAGGSGGTASGGSTNQTGGRGGGSGTGTGEGGDGANGGSGGGHRATEGNGYAGSAPGGGGGGAAANTQRSGGAVNAAGGGGGGYSTRTYSAGSYSIGQQVTIVVGRGGAGGNSNYDGGVGASGRVIVRWD